MGLIVSAGWSATCEQFLGKVPNRFRGSRIEMRWLDDNFQTIEASTSDVEKDQFTCTFILRLIGGMLMPDKFRNLAHLKWLIQLVNLREAGRLSWRSAVLATLYQEMCLATIQRKTKIGGCMWNNPTSHSSIPTELKDILLALDEEIEEDFIWMPYTDLRIQEYVPEEFLANRNIWHVKVSLVFFVTVEMHESDRVMRQFESNADSVRKGCFMAFGTRSQSSTEGGDEVTDQPNVHMKTRSRSRGWRIAINTLRVRGCCLSIEVNNRFWSAQGCVNFDSISGVYPESRKTKIDESRKVKLSTRHGCVVARVVGCVIVHDRVNDELARARVTLVNKTVV
ncbi:hypothetical protein J1N35_005957 [Gossypium stocksii]|uniref:Aminotransferase-like plant mobile domain-containing protein n=1 Tax=Gossypium stocksii TaxID=47602 RepID=A0A9D3WFK8_9ROSI|nr:hypothetical protein J1N35_005957 [Gossypium stocksii]